MLIPEVITLESVQVPRFREAYEQLRPHLSTLPEPLDCPDELDIPVLVTRLLSVWPIFAAHREQLTHDSLHFDPRQLDELKRYTLALGHAHGLHLSAAAALAECLAAPTQARAMYRYLVNRGNEPAPAMEPLTARALADAIAQRLHTLNHPLVLCEAQALIDRLEAFSVDCARAQDQLEETAHHRSTLLGLLVVAYDRARFGVLALGKGAREVAEQLPEASDLFGTIARSSSARDFGGNLQ